MDLQEKLTFTVRQIAAQPPLIHVNSNAVTIREVVDMILASGGTAIAATAPEEAAEITALANGLVINMGTPTAERKKSMVLSGKKANEMGIPVVLDPVGAGASAFRAEILKELLTNLHFTCIRGNRAEIAEIAGIHGVSRGVEGDGAALETETVLELASNLQTVIAVSGDDDLIVGPDGTILKAIGGSAWLKKITGGGCMLTGLIAAGLAAAQKTKHPAMISTQHETSSDFGDAVQECPKPVTGPIYSQAQVVHAVMQSYKDAALEAERAMATSGQIGTGTFRMLLLDAVSRWSLRP